MYRPPLHKPNGEIVDSDHLLPKGWWDDHSEDIGEPHTGKQLEEWFNKNHKCVKCGKIIRTHEQAKLRCKSSPQSKERIRMYE